MIRCRNCGKRFYNDVAAKAHRCGSPIAGRSSEGASRPSSDDVYVPPIDLGSSSDSSSSSDTSSSDSDSFSGGGGESGGGGSSGDW